MEAPHKKPKSVIPKQAQIPLVAVGLVLLAYFAWDFANNMGWVGGPPKAKTPVAAKQPPTGSGGVKQPAPNTTPAPAPPATPTIAGQPPGPPGVSSPGAPTTDLEALRAPGHDPMAELSSTAKPPAPPPAAPTGHGPTPPPAIPSGEPPPLPPPMPTPGGAQPGFPSPVVGGAPPPPAVPAATQPAAPAPHRPPAAVTVTYPLARRGTRAQAAAPAVSVMGTISGNRGSLAVIHPNDAARGQYVKPGDTIVGSGAHIESISSGSVKVGGRGGTREVSVRARRIAPAAPPIAPVAPETPTAASPAPE
ncbi:MAG: hypothetical protein FJX74_04040 [Armatimonadetes bacterium]|nr:hypothetical protein [Armatimonadota bacterium]